MVMATKKIALLTLRDSINNLYYQELSKVFYDYLEVMPFSMETDIISAHAADISLLLTTGPKVYSSYRYLSSAHTKVISLDHDFEKKRVDLLRKLPAGTNALVCFNYVLVGYKTAAILYEMGISNLNLTVYHPSASIDFSKFDIIITDDHTTLPPHGTCQVISLGRRKISFGTLLDIAINLDILDSTLESRINEYCSHATSSYRSAPYIFHDTTYSKSHFQSLMDYVDYGIVMVDQTMRIAHYNQRFLDCFNIHFDVTNKNLLELGIDCICRFAAEDDRLKNQLIKDKVTGKTFIMSKIQADDWPESQNYILLIKDMTELSALKQQLKKEVEFQNLVTKYTFADIKGDSPLLRDCIRRAKIIAKIDKPTLITGESGTGKELFVQSIHNVSTRAAYPFIGINCANLPSNLLESELFGYEEGSFTGARKKGKIGLFELVNHGTLFLDELGEMNLETQAKLLRVLEEKQIIRLGGQQIIAIDVRIITASNKDLKELVKAGLFRLDLYYRLNTLTLKIPPLRERKEDISILIQHFLHKEGFQNTVIDKDVWDYLKNAPFEGNVRELRSCVEYMANISEGHIRLEHLPEYMQEELANTTRLPHPTEFTELQVLDSQDELLIQQILLLLKNKKQGRRMLFVTLKSSFSSLSEYKLRALLAFLKKQQLIDFDQGRGGAFLTQKGWDKLSQ